MAQLGAPTAVVNATLRGFLEGAHPVEVLGVVGGARGLLRGNLHPLRLAPADPAAGREGGGLVMNPGVADQPGAWLGAGRHGFSEEELEAVVDLLAAADVGGLALIGGNGTMRLADELHRRTAQRGRGPAVVGVPKTVDNDVDGTDHAPGYPSAARFLVEAVWALALDLAAMTSIEQVRIVETLGGRAGWLALATLAARHLTGGAPHLVYLPERPFDDGAFLADVERSVAAHGAAFVVVAEGIAGPGRPSRFERPDYNRPASGGVACELAALVREHLGHGTRADVLGAVQRCAPWTVSPIDRAEARAMGQAAARLLRRGEGGKMLALLARRPGEPGGAEPVTVPLSAVAGQTRVVPARWVPAAAEPSEDFVAWLRPLLGDLAVKG